MNHERGGSLASLKGKLLISGGRLFDPNFRQTVVLLGAHDEQGAVGVVLNHRLGVTVKQAVSPLAGLVGTDEFLYDGGPVQPQAPVLLVELAAPGLLDLPVFGSVGFLTGDVPAEIGSAVLRARVFAGHAGWGPGQLEAELQADAWIVEQATENDVFTPDPGTLWRRVLERKGPPYAALARIPFDPSMN